MLAGGATLPSLEELPKRKRVLTLFPVVFSCNTVTALDSSWSWTVATEVDTFFRPFAVTRIDAGQEPIFGLSTGVDMRVWGLSPNSLQKMAKLMPEFSIDLSRNSS